MKFTKNIGFITPLAIYLIMIGILGLTGMLLGQLPPIVALILAGIFILIGKMLGVVARDPTEGAHSQVFSKPAEMHGAQRRSAST